MSGRKVNRKNKKSAAEAVTVVNPHYFHKSFKTEGYKNFDEFYSFYLGEHSNLVNRRLHLIASTIALLITLLAVITANYLLLPLALVQAYALAWIGNFFFEKNKPAAFKHPLYAFMGNWRMWYEVLTGLRSF